MCKENATCGAGILLDRPEVASYYGVVVFIPASSKKKAASGSVLINPERLKAGGTRWHRNPNMARTCGAMGK